MSQIVSITDGKALTTSLTIAEGVGNPHSTIIRLVRDNLPDFQEFGLVRFEIRPRAKGQHGGGDTEYALLNEQQATLLMTSKKHWLGWSTFCHGIRMNSTSSMHTLL